MNKVVLAGFGYLGKFIEQQCPTGYRKEFYKLSRNENDQDPNIGDHIKVDFDSRDIKVSKILERSIVVYMAPPDKNKEGDPRLANFLEASKETKIEKIIYISTSGVYGDCAGATVSETAILNPKTTRAIKRVAAEKLITSYAKTTKTKYIIFRVPGIYGKNRLPLDRIYKREPLVNRSESRITNLINVEDLARVVWASIKKDIVNEIINVSDGNPITSTEYYLAIYKALNLNYPNFIKMKDANELFSERRIEFMKESRVLDITKMTERFKECIKFKKLSDGIKESLF